MIYNKNILQPVKREDFSTTISSEAKWDNSVNPEQYFNPMVEQIKKFSVGRYFWFVANLMQGTIYKSGGMVEQISGLGQTFFDKSPPDVLFKRTHPDDIHQMFAFTNQWIQVLSQLPITQKAQVHPTIYVRLKNPQQIYKWVMVQFANHIFDVDGNAIYAFTLVTDISHIKTEGPAMMSILNSYNKSCQHFLCSDEKGILQSSNYPPNLTNREIEVLNHLSIGQSSKQIAVELNISIKTVDNHRQSMLQKTNSKSTGELISIAIKSGYL